MTDIIDRFTNIYVDNYQIAKFDTSSTDNRYRIVSKTCDIEVTESIVELIDYIRENDGIQYFQVVKAFCEKYNILEEENVEKIIKLLFSKKLFSSKKIQKEEIKFEDLHRNQMKNLWLRIKLIDTEKFKPLFSPFQLLYCKYPVILGLFIFGVLDIIYLIFYYGNDTMYGNKLYYISAYDYLFITLFSIFSMFLHEIGHIVVAQKYNSRTGGIGIGMYFMMFVGYSDVHETWNLPRKERKYVSIAGFYMNLILTIPLFFVLYFYNLKVISDYIILLHIGIIYNLNPFLKMDGYWFLSDIIGVPNLQNRVKKYLFGYLPTKLKSKSESIINPFKAYSKKTRFVINIYIFIFASFMIIFLSNITYAGLNLYFNINKEIISPILYLFNSVETDSAPSAINTLIRNLIVMFIFSLIAIGYIRRLIGFIIKKIIR